jgi:hypothetical protein
MAGVRTEPVGSPDLVAHTGFLLAEDEALKSYLKGLTVPERPGSAKTQEIGVWFRWPEGERQIKYPFITIDLIDVAPAYELWTSEYSLNTDSLYWPSVSPSLGTVANPSTTRHYARPFLAFKLAYQISLHTRSVQHDRYLNSLFFTDYFPPRPFWIGVDADNTWRRCELVDYAQADMTETTETGNKRIFRKVYTISMLAEIPQERLALAWKVLRTFVAVVDRDYVDRYLGDIMLPNADITSVPAEERAEAGELAYYVNDFTDISVEVATAVGSASDAETDVPT